MNLEECLQNVSIIGAAGKMGSGISLLLAQQMGILKAKNPHKTVLLYLIDTRDEGLCDLVTYIRVQIEKLAEKQVVMLREIYQDRNDLVDNEEIIREYVNTTMSILRPTKGLLSAADSSLVFEAVIENKDLKIDIFKKLKSSCKPEAFFFTNTSSIPIQIIDKGAELEGRIIGYHFYNPPAIQKLLEIISWENTNKELEKLAHDIAKKLHKVVVSSNDIAGFIGNGHFIREGLYAIEKTLELAKNHSLAEAIYLMNKVTQDFLMRPMGIFQLLDYVGIDVFHFILQIMDRYIEEEKFESSLVNTMIQSKVLGGQKGDGSQKDGFFQYEKGKITGVYCSETKEYKKLNNTEELDKLLGDCPPSCLPWKNIVKQKNILEKVTNAFQEARETDTLGCKLTVEYADASKKIALNLVAAGVAKTNEDVDTVLLTGFYHAYGITQI